MNHDDSGQPLVFHPSPTGAIDRRRAMALMAASVALAGSGCSRPPREQIHPWVDMPEARGGGLPLYYASAFLREGHAQGVLVGTREGRPIKVEGNPLHPSSLGATDAFAQASVLTLWDPDRSQAVTQGNVTWSWQAFEAQWRAKTAFLGNGGGEGLRILTGPVGSPTLRAQLAALLERLPRARWHQYAPLHDGAAWAGAVAAFGQPVQVVPHLDRARCIVALGGDPFSDGPAAVRNARDWSSQRAQPGAGAALFALEATPGLFGARADHRLALPPGEISAAIARVAVALEGGDAPATGRIGSHPFEQALAAAIRQSGPDTLLLPGASLSPGTHALVHSLHQKLGCLGRTLDLIAPQAMAPEAASLASLVDDMNAGAVDTLLILDANPMYDAPGALEFSKALSKVLLSVHAGLFQDETALACGWHLPLAHTFEQWSDAPAHDGSATLIQPAIAPLYDGRSLHEIVALLAGDDERDGMRLVQRYWRAHAGAGDFDAFWQDSLRRGVVAGSAARPLSLRAAARVRWPAEPQGKPGLVAIFTADPSVLDGRFANNGWLQELPRPFTKLTWDNALLIGERTARRLGVATGDKVRIKADAFQVDAPAWVLAAHAEEVVTLPLGYGRRRGAGRVGEGVGFNAYRLQPAQGGALGVVRIERLNGTHAFAVSQHAMDQEGRELARTIDPEGAIAEKEHATMYPAYSYPEHAWGMAIDLDTCIGCNACTMACQAENNSPVVGKAEVAAGREMHWIRVDRYETPEVAGSIFQPVPCMHCEKAPCELVCPVGATMHDSEGLNVQVYNRCVGTRFCSNNCPYKVRRFNFKQYSDVHTESLKGQRNPEVTVRNRGVMEKCTYCLQRIARARQHSQATGTPLADGDVVTACQAVCPAGAIHFGDLNNPASEVSRVKQSPRNYSLLGELNTRPRTTYLARVKRKG